jgi:3-oxoacyl-[acyl-carrier protein] reductase
MDLRINGRTALVTGASKGIGLASAESLAGEGVNVILVSRTKADLEKGAEGIRKRHNVRVEIEALDISDSKSVDILAKKYPGIDILVNNAGAIPGGHLIEIDEAKWRHAWDLKVFGYINMTRAFFDLMKKRGNGVIVNILGAAGEKMDFDYVAGSAGNASLMAFTRAMGGRSVDAGVRIVGINPGAIMTDRIVTMMRKRANDRLGDAERWQELLKPLPFSRAGKPEEIGDMVAFLASDRSGYTSGTVITIDGGSVNRGGVF